MAGDGSPWHFLLEALGLSGHWQLQHLQRVAPGGGNLSFFQAPPIPVALVLQTECLVSSASFRRACGWLATSFPTPLACPRLFLQERQLESGILFNTLLLPNQTWIHMPTQSKTNLPTSSCHEGKHNIDCRCQARSPGQLVLQTPELPADFQESIFTGQVRE